MFSIFPKEWPFYRRRVNFELSFFFIYRSMFSLNLPAKFLTIKPTYLLPQSEQVTLYTPLAKYLFSFSQYVFTKYANQCLTQLWPVATGYC